MISYNNFLSKFILYLKQSSVEQKSKGLVKSKSINSGTVKSAIEGVVFINLSESTSIFIGEIIKFQINIGDRKSSLKGMVIGLSKGSGEIMLFGDTSNIFPGDI
jgi:hypothetical protein